MTPYYADDWLTVYQGDCRDVLPTLPEASVDCVVTSPPYWGLRDYGTATWAPNIDDERVGREFIARYWERSTEELRAELVAEAEGCDHKPPSARRGVERRTSTLDGGVATITAQEGARHAQAVCPQCGAVRQDGQLGLEPTPEQYVANLVAVFRELRRVLKPSGTCWLNLGDSYYTTPAGNRTPSGISQNTAKRLGKLDEYNTQPKTFPGLKPKDLVGIPWRVAFALQADGWWLRSDIIWSKPNPMPESVTDRPTKAHEYLFLLTKAERYYYDADAVAEALTDSKAAGAHPGSHGVGALVGSGTQRAVHGEGLSHDLHTKPTRNLRSVWTIATRPYPGAHFAVFPPELPERCIKAGCPEGGVVLDPFAGSGTVGLVANRLSRRAILIDLNPAYLEQQMKRNAQIPAGLSA